MQVSNTPSAVSSARTPPPPAKADLLTRLQRNIDRMDPATCYKVLRLVRLTQKQCNTEAPGLPSEGFSEFGVNKGDIQVICTHSSHSLFGRNATEYTSSATAIINHIYQKLGIDPKRVSLDGVDGDNNKLEAALIVHIMEHGLDDKTCDKFLKTLPKTSSTKFAQPSLKIKIAILSAKHDGINLEDIQAELDQNIALLDQDSSRISSLFGLIERELPNLDGRIASDIVGRLLEKCGDTGNRINLSPNRLEALACLLNTYSKLQWFFQHKDRYLEVLPLLVGTSKYDELLSRLSEGELDVLFTKITDPVEKANVLMGILDKMRGEDTANKRDRFVQKLSAVVTSHEFIAKLIDGNCYEDVIKCLSYPQVVDGFITAFFKHKVTNEIAFKLVMALNAHDTKQAYFLQNLVAQSYLNPIIRLMIINRLPKSDSSSDKSTMRELSSSIVQKIDEEINKETLNFLTKCCKSQNGFELLNGLNFARLLYMLATKDDGVNLSVAINLFVQFTQQAFPERSTIVDGFKQALMGLRDMADSSAYTRIMDQVGEYPRILALLRPS